MKLAPVRIDSQLRVVVLCLLPDAGHVIPLVRIAHQLEQAGLELLFIGPDEVRTMLVNSSLQLKTIGSVRPDNFRTTMAKFTRANECIRFLYLDRWFEEQYFEPVHLAALQRLDTALDLARTFAPRLIITDDHLFTGAYKWISEHCRVPLIMHYSAGSSLPMLRSLPPTLERRSHSSLELMGKVLGGLLSRTERLLRPTTHKEKRRRREYLQGRWMQLESVVKLARYPTVRIATGTALLEQRLLRNRLDIAVSDIFLFPSQPPMSTGNLSSELRTWLDEKPGTPLVYACFGTMAIDRTGLIDRIAAACQTLGFRLLCVGSTAPTSWQGHSTFLRWEQWVPQVDVLARSAVSAFVSHAGAGSVQEALWFGKPLLAIPILWDQPYNAWMAEQLGFGIALNRRKATIPRLSASLAALIRTPRYRDRAIELSATMRAETQRAELVNFVRDLTHSRREISFLAPAPPIVSDGNT